MSGTFSYLEVEAALCVWECLNDWTLGDANERANNDDGFRAGWIALRENVGSAEMRCQSVELGQWCLKVFDILTAHNPDFFDGYAYDWEVIPAILAHAEKDEAPTIYKADFPPVANVAAMVAHDFLFREFESSCEMQARDQWAYKELVSDHEDKVEQAFAEGREPAEFIKWLGEKYDLIRADEWFMNSRRSKG